jgi:type IV secretion system protein VirD4
MSGTKILWGQILVVFLIVLGTLWGATQWTARALDYQIELQPIWFMLGRTPIYPPPAFFWWWFSYDAYAPAIFLRGACVAASGGIVSAAVAIGMSVWRARETQRALTYGSARWATSEEVQAGGMLGEDGVVLGRFAHAYLRHDGPEHVLCFAPTRSGKGVGLVVPTLLTWPGSCIVHDIKGENWSLTAGFRARIGRVLLFDPTNAQSSRYNPLLEVRRGEWEVRDAQNIADVLVDPEGSLEKRNHWEKTSHALLVGAILHVLYAEADKTLAGAAALLSDPRRPIKTTLRAMMTTPHLGAEGVHPVVASAAQELLNKADNEQSGVLSTAMSFLGLYRDPVIAHVTGASDWRISDLVDGSRPASLYLVVPPSDISRTKPLVRLILNQIGRRLTEELTPTSKRHRLLLMLDEFPALGRLDFFESALAFMAGYRIKGFLIAQSLNQIEKAYGANNAILDNCHVRVSFATNDERTAKRVSDALGTATEMRAMRNYAGHRLAPWLGHLMVSRTETARQLLTPGEVMQLPPDEEIVMAAGVAPVRARKARYYEDRRFTERLLPAPSPSHAPGRAQPTDDWTSRTPIAAARQAIEAPVDESSPGQGDDHDEEHVDDCGVAKNDPANGGIRREPDQPAHDDIVARPFVPQDEFTFEQGGDPADAAANRKRRERMSNIARQASLDKNDGIAI